jgi:hypothetical protein
MLPVTFPNRKDNLFPDTNLKKGFLKVTSGLKNPFSPSCQPAPRRHNDCGNDENPADGLTHNNCRKKTPMNSSIKSVDKSPYLHP